MTASVIATFDPSKSIDATTSGLTVNGTNLPPNTEFAYDAAADTLIIATKPMTGVCEVVAGGWCAFIGDGSQGSRSWTSFLSGRTMAASGSRSAQR